MQIFYRWFKPNPQELRSLLRRRESNKGACLFTAHVLAQSEALDVKFSTEDINNGKFCFYGSLLLSFCLGSNMKDLYQPLFSYSLLYVLIDSFLDAPGRSEKKDTLCHLHALLEGESPPPDDAFLSLVAKHYTCLLKYKPAVKKDLLKIFLIELESVPFQASADHTEAEFMSMCRKKGALSLRALFTLASDKGDMVDADEIGFCIQLLDDLYDVFLDKEQGIHTIATYHLDKHGNCDQLYSYTLNKIDSLPSRFILLQTVMMAFAVCMAQNTACLSPNLKEQIEPFFFLPPGVQLSQVL
ncbi:Hypothetical protein ZAZAV_64 [Cedratvirus Zaza IHUMI]|uniref:Uncharacterized protein n=1 Tax=Cedratvirus Zaza IHUMI TaxID=2126979 RepID=A0A2R8FCZ8_9VIRU|nr:isoprenoid biosynthesis enzyme domain protein [Cedratvirus plubellavi]SPN78894.1 Hypothetical protein ZAZAV_64 [Cedratvirus Zaza IHUMI]